jgi:hypothetical protein
MSLQKTFALFTLFLTTLVVFGLSFIISNPQTVSAADCTINSAQFVGIGENPKPAGWYTDNLRNLIHIKITTTGCEGQEIEVSVGLINENTGALLNPVGALDGEPFTVPNSNKVDIYAWNGEENCSVLNSTCTYAIAAYHPNGQGYTSYDPESGSNLGLLSYPCDGNCLTGSGLLPSPDWELVASDNSDGGLCTITSASITPSGEQTAGFYNDNAREAVDITLQTESCEGKTVEFSVRTSKENDLDRDVNNINNKPLTVPLSNALNIQAVTGEDWCPVLFGEDQDCSYYIVVENPAGIEFSFEDTVNISYRCDGTLNGSELRCQDQH